MAQGLKFMFDRRFDLPEGSVSSNVAEVVSSVLAEMNRPDINENSGVPNTPAPEPEITYTESEVAALKQEIFDEGVLKGKADAARTREEEMKSTIAAMGEIIRQIQERQTAFEEIQEENCMKVGLAICEKILPDLIKKNGAEEVKVLIKQAMPSLQAEKRFTVKVAANNEKEIKEYVKKYLADNGMETAVNVLKDESLDSADCVIEWFGGSIERKTERTLEEIKGTVAAYTSALDTAADDKESVLPAEVAKDEEAAPKAEETKQELEESLPEKELKEEQKEEIKEDLGEAPKELPEQEKGLDKPSDDGDKALAAEVAPIKAEEEAKPTEDQTEQPTEEKTLNEEKKGKENG